MKFYIITIEHLIFDFINRKQTFHTTHLHTYVHLYYSRYTFSTVKSLV